LPAVDQILVSAGPGETRLALVADNRPVEFVIDRGDGAPGDVVLGRVVGVNRALNAAFVDIGARQPGFLAAPKGLSEGDSVLVQVTAAARGDKGAALTRALTLAGRYLVYSPTRAGLNLSQRLSDPGERERLHQVVASMLTPGEGVVIRSAAAEAPEDAVRAELLTLRLGWRNIETTSAVTGPPARLHAPSALAHVLTEHPSVRRVRVDDPQLLAEARRLFPLAELEREAFDDYDAAEVLVQALERHVPLAGGGALIIETTAAVTVVDVDSGPGAPLEANLAAVPEIARQLRLRGLAGHILVDVIPSRDKKILARIVDALRTAVADDPTPTQVVGTTPLGLVEMIRERRRPSLAEMMLADQAPRLNDETIGLKGLRALLRAATERPGVPLALAATPAVIAALRRRAAALADAERRLGRPVTLVEDRRVELYDLVEKPR
jgi:ribonuclease E/ribonuclease G